MIALDELKSVARVLQEAGKIEQYNQILEAQQKLLEMQDENFKLRRRVTQLEEKLKTRGNLLFENNAYWVVNENKKEGPFCSCCWDKDNKTIRMLPCGEKAFSECPNCKNTVQIDPNYIEPSQLINRNDHSWF